MSKKKKKKKEKKEKKEKAAASKKGAKKSKQPARPAASNRTASATIFVYKIDGGTRVRTSPQLLTAGPGYVEWTVVNLASDAQVDVEIIWPGGSPWGGAAPISIKNGNVRRSLEGAKDGRYKYNVTADGYTEDPELEVLEN